MSPSKKLFYDDRKKTALRQPTHSGYQKLIIDYKHILSSLDILSCCPCLMLNGVIYVRNNYEYFVSRHCRQVNRCPFIIFLYFFLIQDGGAFYGSTSNGCNLWRVQWCFRLHYVLHVHDNVYLVIVLKIWGNNRALVIVTLHTQTKLQNSREPLSYRSFGETLRSFNSFSLTLFAKFNWQWIY